MQRGNEGTLVILSWCVSLLSLPGVLIGGWGEWTKLLFLTLYLADSTGGSADISKRSHRLAFFSALDVMSHTTGWPSLDHPENSLLNEIISFDTMSLVSLIDLPQWFIHRLTQIALENGKCISIWLANIYKLNCIFLLFFSYVHFLLYNFMFKSMILAYFFPYRLLCQSDYFG